MLLLLQIPHLRPPQFGDCQLAPAALRLRRRLQLRRPADLQRPRPLLQQRGLRLWLPRMAEMHSKERQL